MKLEHLHMIYIQIVYLIKIYIIHFKLFIKTRIYSELLHFILNI